MKNRTLLLLSIFLCFAIFSSGCGKKQTINAKENTQSPSEKNLSISENNLPEPKEPEIEKKKEGLPGVFAVSIDNQEGAYPQTGLEYADRIYELLSEGGITRLLALYYSQEAEKIGPVRSSRPYFLEIVAGLGAPLAHAGGSTKALNMAVELKTKDLDEIYNAAECFWRDKNRKMPHNLFTSTDRLLAGAEKRNYSTASLRPLAQGKSQGGVSAERIEIIYRRGGYEVAYAWDSEKATYKRLVNNKPHRTSAGIELETQNLLILETETRNINGKIPETQIDIIGRGRAIFATDGKIYEGEWVKKDAFSDFQFLYAGKEMLFVGEHAWISFVPSFAKVNIK